MSRRFIHQVHIADGFADDCEELIHRWLKTETLTYETFCEIWKDMKFAFLYHGRTCGAEMAELSEELIHIAKHYMVANTSNFEESVAGVFLVYALLNLQPYPGFAALRIVPDDVAAIHRIETVARRQKRYDVLYILGSLLIDGPVQYHAAARERGMESSLRKYLEGFTGIDQLGVRPRGVFFRQNEELDLLRELASITRRYTDAKKAVGSENNRNLNYTSATFPSELDASLKQIINGIIDEKHDCTTATDSTSTMQSIRDKAMKLSVEGVRHLRSTADKKKSPEKPSPRVECEIKQKPGKIRQGSPKKPVTSLAKRKSSGILPKKKRRRRKISTSSSSSDEILSSNESVNSDKNSGDDEQNDLNLESFNKEKVTENDETQEKEINITIDSLPAFIRKEQDGKMIEIEIIDKLKTNVKDELVEESKKRNKKLQNNSPKQNIGEGSSSEFKETSETPQKKNPVKNEEKSTGVIFKRPERRDLKKTLLKSKFKRLGMLNVANFKEGDNTEDAERKKHS